MRTKTQNIVCWILSGLLALAFLGSGLSKLAGVEMQIKNFESWGYPLWLRFPIGLAEVAFAIGLLAPKFRTQTLYVSFAWAVVAMVTHLQAGQAAMIGGPILFAAIAAVDLYIWTRGSASRTNPSLR